MTQHTLLVKAGGNVISGVALDHVGTDVPAGFGNSRLNSGRFILLFGISYPPGWLDKSLNVAEAEADIGDSIRWKPRLPDCHYVYCIRMIP